MPPEQGAVDLKVVGVDSHALEQTYSRPLDLTKYEGDPAAQLSAAVKDNGVVVFGKAWCPFCLEVKRIFDARGVKYALLNVDDHANGAAVHAALKKEYKQATVPYVFIGGELLGGCSDVNAAVAEGRLDTLLRAAGCAPIANLSQRRNQQLAVLEGKSRLPAVFFSFPEAVDDRAVRFTSLWGLIICLLVAIFYTRNAAHWVMVGLMVDFCLRIVGGGNLSPLGSLSTFVVAIMELFGSKPKWMAGPPKQFAALCGLMFAALASLFYLLELYNEKLDIVGLSFTCALGAASMLEAVFGFCLGCFFFGLMVQFGIVNKSIYQIFTTITPEVQYTYDEMNKRLNEPAPTRHVKHMLDANTPLAIDFKYKDQTDDHTREDFNVFKHVKITHFLVHMSLAGLACAWKIAVPTNILDAPKQVYYAIGITSAVTYVIWACLYITKMCMYPQKVRKEWISPVSGNVFAVPLITLVLFAYLVYDQNGVVVSAIDGLPTHHGNTLILGKVLFWMGAPTTLLLSMWQSGVWLTTHKDIEAINPAWMIGPVGNFVAAMVGPMIDPVYLDAMQLWFGFAFISWMLLFAATFYKAVLNKEQDDRARPLLGIWVAAPAVMAGAYLSCYLPGWQAYLQPDLDYVSSEGRRLAQASMAPDGSFQDFIFINLNWISVSLALVFLVGFYRPFFGRLKFDMSYWAVGFPSAALCFTTLLYHGLKPGRLSGGIAIAALAFSSAINCTLALQTLAGILRRRIFTPDVKWGPISFMRLTHEAFRGAMPRLVAAAKCVAEAAGPEARAGPILELTEAWRMVKLVHHEHAMHEDKVIFKTWNDHFPGVTQQSSEEHADHRATDKVDTAVRAAQESGDATTLVAAVEAFAEELLAHLKHEESHVTVFHRKYIPQQLSRQIVRDCWDMSAAAAWAELIPWVLNNLPMLQQRVRFLKALLWAMPERCQHIGIMVALGVDEVQWFRITQELPEIVPRGAVGWERYY